MKRDFDILIIGAGLTGLTAALACAHRGLKCAILDQRHPLDAGRDPRSSALATASYRLLEAIGGIEHLDNIQPIYDILITDAELGRYTSPLRLHFDGADIGGTMGYMARNEALKSALMTAVLKQDLITIMAPVTVTSSVHNTAVAQIQLKDGQSFTADLIIAADGRNSRLRKGAGIGVQGWPYKQKALTVTLAHELPHDGVAHEIFYPQGPFAILPLTGHRSSIVWSDKPAAIEAALMLDETGFVAELARRIGGFLGEITPETPPIAYPLSLQMAERYTAARLALVGDAAHVIHPIAGQGLNMGLRDVASLVDVLAEARSLGRDIGGAALSDYEPLRRFDNNKLAASTDIFNRIYSTGFAPVKHARRLGMGMVNNTTALRRFFMLEAAGETGDLPSLMQ